MGTALLPPPLFSFIEKIRFVLLYRIVLFVRVRLATLSHRFLNDIDNISNVLEATIAVTFSA